MQDLFSPTQPRPAAGGKWRDILAILLSGIRAEEDPGFLQSVRHVARVARAQGAREGRPDRDAFRRLAAGGAGDPVDYLAAAGLSSGDRARDCEAAVAVLAGFMPLFPTDLDDDLELRLMVEGRAQHAVAVAKAVLDDEEVTVDPGRLAEIRTAITEDAQARA